MKDILFNIKQEMEVFERLHNISPNVIVLGKARVDELFPDLSMYKPDSELYMFGMKVVIDYKDPKRVDVGYMRKVMLDDV